MRSFCSIACSLASGQLLVQRIRWVGAGIARKSSTSTDSSDAQQTVVVNSLIGAIGWGVTEYDWVSFSTSFHVTAAYLAVAAPNARKLMGIDAQTIGRAIGHCCASLSKP